MLTALMVLASVFAYAQKPMIGYTPNNIKQQNYLEFGTPYSSWHIDQGDGFYMLSTDVTSISGFAYYYFADGGELNYRYALIMYDNESYQELKKATIKGCVYQFGGWYKQTESGLFVYFKEGVSDGKSVYTIVYSHKTYETN